MAVAGSPSPPSSPQSSTALAIPATLRAVWSTRWRYVLIGLALYVLAASIVRFASQFQPYVAETDWKQWVWQYWRYHIEGAFPPGHPITDYTFNAQPPLYHVVMSSL